MKTDFVVGMGDDGHYWVLDDFGKKRPISRQTFIDILEKSRTLREGVER